MSACLVPVVRVPSCARGPPCVFFLLHMYNKYVLLYGTVVQYEKKGGHEPRTKIIPFNRKDVIYVGNPSRKPANW